MKELEEIRKKFRELKNEERAIGSKRYLKSQYNFYGLKVPEMRRIIKNYNNLDIESTLELFNNLWNSENHEEMNSALYLLEYYVKEYPEKIWEFIMKKIEKATSWDLVDEMSSKIIGEILADKTKFVDEIKRLSKSKNPWLRRISIVSNLPLIRKNRIDLTINLSEKLIYDDDIYVQKGAGWMLREAGKRDKKRIKEFILNHIDMKAYAFSYSTEKMLEIREIRKKFLKKERLKNSSR